MEHKSDKIYSITVSVLIIVLMIVLSFMIGRISTLERQLDDLKNTQASDNKNTKQIIKDVEDRVICVEYKLEDIMPNDDLP